MGTRTAVLSFGLSISLAGALGAACDAEPDAGSGGASSSSSGGVGGAATELGSEHVGRAELQRLVTHLASDELEGRDEGTSGGALARSFIIEEMQRCGIEPAVNNSFEQPVSGGAGVNVIGLIRGSDPALAERHLLLSAHYDHLGIAQGQIYNGADDNAAGVATLIGIGCALGEHQPARSVIVAAWDAEEPPTFLSPEMGSRFYAENPVVPLAQTDAVVVFELVGAGLWQGYQGHFVVGAELSPQLAAAIDATPVPEGLLALRGGLHLVEEWPTGHQAWSDYDAFRNLGTPFYLAANGQTERYHTPADDADTLDYPKMERQAVYHLNIAWRLVNAVDTPAFDAGATDYARDALMVKTALEHALAPGGLVDSLALGAESRAKLEADLADAAAIAAKLDAGGVASEADVRRLRDGTQRLMCYPYPAYSEAVCNMF